MHLHHTYSELDGFRVFHVKSPQAGADRWESQAAGAQGRYTEGVQGTQIDVAARAIAQQNVMLQNITRAITSGLWARRITESGGTANWKQKTVAKASNYGTGIAAGKGRYLESAQKLYPYIQQMQDSIRQMPRGTLADSKARALAAIDMMAAYRQNR